MPDEGVLQGVLARSQCPETLGRFRAQGEGCGWCSEPIRLVGSQMTVDRATGEIVRSYSTAAEPDGVLLKACGTRRATRCPSCAATYGADARMLVRAGLSGGKGISPTVSTHPMVFATFTAPSFGAVHGARSGGGHSCRPGDRGRRCPHGRPVTCWARHRPDDPGLGEPLCPDCYDYEGAVLWNARCPELWRRTTTYIARELARLCGTNIRRLRELVRLSFVKVAEYQRRGVVHVHAVIRLDATADNDAAPPAPVDVGGLAAAVRVAAVKVSAPLPAEFGGAARWGDQIDLRVIVSSLEHVSDHQAGDDGRHPAVTGARAVANYLSKYATKSTDPLGALDRRLHDLSELAGRRVTGHFKRLVETAWTLGGRSELAPLRLRAWAHTLGFGGHWLTKSRRYSVTFGHLRNERLAWRIGRRPGGPDGPTTAVVACWTWVGIGWRTRGDAWMAQSGQRARADARLAAREALCVGRAGREWGDPPPGDRALIDREWW
jgi:hypothetical protein